MGGVFRCDRAADAPLFAVSAQLRLPARRDGAAVCDRRTATLTPELRLSVAGLDRLRLRRPRPTRDDEPALVHGDRPRRSLACVALRESAALPRRNRRPDRPLGADHDAAGRGWSRARRWDLACATRASTGARRRLNPI